MRKKTVVCLTIGLMVAGLLSETPSETEEATEEEVTTTEEEPEPSDILAENGIVITPQAEVTSFMAGVEENDAYTDNTISVPLSVTVTTTPSEEEGYADTVAVYVMDASDLGADIYFTWNVQPFDRYTGYALDTSNESTPVGEGRHDDVTLIDVDGTQYDVSCVYTPGELDNGIWQQTVTLHHPVDYDGAVFAFGAATASNMALSDAIDWSNSVNVTDYPDFLHSFEYYCTAADQ